MFFQSRTLNPDYIFRIQCSVYEFLVVIIISYFVCAGAEKVTCWSIEIKDQANRSLVSEQESEDEAEANRGRLRVVEKAMSKSKWWE